MKIEQVILTFAFVCSLPWEQLLFCCLGKPLFCEYVLGIILLVENQYVIAPIGMNDKSYSFNSTWSCVNEIFFKYKLRLFYSSHLCILPLLLVYPLYVLWAPGELKGNWLWFLKILVLYDSLSYSDGKCMKSYSEQK